MTGRNLSRLLRPKSIALFGGSWAENVIVQLLKSGFEGEIWPVHPRRESICDIPCVASIEELPDVPDASFVGVNRELSIEIVQKLAEMGAGGATCFASGFLESEENKGADLQARLVEAAGDMPILGPNCYGLINYLDNVTLWPDQHGGRKAERGVALIGQSSNILINMTMQKRTLPIAYTIAVGNQAQTSLSEIASAVLDDERVTAIGLYIEGFGDIREFEAMATKAKNLGKSIVAIKSGKSEKSKAATMTHTASLAGGAAASSAFLERQGVVEVNSVAVFLETLKLLHAFGPLRGDAVASLSCSGGEAGLISDMAHGSRINFRDLSSTAHERLKSVLGPIVTVANPLDYHTFIWGDQEALTATYTAVFADQFDLNVVIMDVPPTDRCDMDAWQKPLQAVVDAAQATGAPVALLGTLPENLSEPLSDWLTENGVLPIHGMEEMIEAIDAVIRAGEIRNGSGEPVMLAQPETIESEVLNEADSKSALAFHGIAFPHSRVAESFQDIPEISKEILFPVALKGLGIAHKSEAGAVVLNLQTESEVLNAAIGMSGVDKFLVEEMVGEPVAEILIGLTRDPTGMFLLTMGAGGVMAELLGDTASILLPASREQIAEKLKKLKVFKLLQGFRGKSAADIDGVVDAVMSVQKYCLANPCLLELDINPLMAMKDRAVAVDALIKLEKRT